MNNRPVIFGIIIVVAIIAGGTATYFLNSKKNAKLKAELVVALANLSNADPAEYNSQIKEEYEKSKVLATEINASYRLSAVSVEIGKDLKPAQTTIRYIFSAGDDTLNNWTITFKEDGSSGFIRAMIPKSDYLGAVTPIDLQKWKVNHVSALQIAEKGGGLDWREQNSLLGAQLILRNDQSRNLPIWNVQYLSGQDIFSVDVEAETGKISKE